MLKRLAVMLGLLGLLLMVAGGVARADQTYHTHHYALSPIGDASLRSGFVENIHANGPNVYAHEIYQLNGAGANSSYQVMLSIWSANLTCSGEPQLQLGTAVVVTNPAGDGVGQAVFTPEQADGLRGLTVSAMWTLFDGNTPTYQTGCEVVQLD